MRIAGWLVCLAVVTFSGAGWVAVAAPAVADIPAPSEDPFYRAPAGYESQSDGTILRSRPVTATALSVPLPVDSWQLLYKSLDSHRDPVADVATVLVPRTPWSGDGPRPLVSYQTAEDSLGSRCAPSYALTAGLGAVTSNAASETVMIATLLSRGWAVVTADYEGPESEFLAGPQAGFAVLDGIRAARHFEPAGLDVNAPTGLWGYSGGAFATAWAAELQQSHAPELGLSGIALGGLPADLEATMRNVDGGYGFGLTFGGVTGIDRAYPETRLSELFTTEGRAAMHASSAACTVDLIATYAFRSLHDYTIDPRPFDLPPLREALAENSPTATGTSAPVYSYHAEADELVPVAVHDEFVRQSCAAGNTLQVVRPPGGSHNTTLISGAQGAIDFLAARFTDAPAVDDCR
ncbi:lipase family protein [Rhodococcus opacus]|uniref:lipase family protein n=1 Tax=Rhodococcus opacus TaxID=37919 RepID=UPI001BAED87A|nr:lipase family protein [Rhodococcus opacus]MDJ0420552.1 lipase family protein [Rhodococcus opacus]MDV7091086.1 lipase family protein [Rhodococcus opacus]UNN04583.1 lipase family protein [Rhodococcus opacus]WKN52381.1 lipase family protein [Rhodococcus opacus]